MGVESYQNTQMHVEPTRAIEYRTLGHLTAMLMKANAPEHDLQSWAQAIYKNQQFWSRVRVNMLGVHTGLPQEMRLQLISLAEWVEKQSILVASGDGEMEGLIAVNQQIMEGLKPHLPESAILETA